MTVEKIVCGSDQVYRAILREPGFGGYSPHNQPFSNFGKTVFMSYQEAAASIWGNAK
jgi:hypothetical protein